MKHIWSCKITEKCTLTILLFYNLLINKRSISDLVHWDTESSSSDNISQAVSYYCLKLGIAQSYTTRHQSNQNLSMQLMQMTENLHFKLILKHIGIACVRISLLPSCGLWEATSMFKLPCRHVVLQYCSHSAVPNSYVAIEQSNVLRSIAMMCMRSDPNTMCFLLSLSRNIIVGDPNAFIQRQKQTK